MSAIAPVVAAASPDAATTSPWRRWLTPTLGDVLFGALMLWLVFFTLNSAEIGLLQDAGTGYHIRVGDYIREHGAVTQTDFLSFSRPGAPFYAWEWLAGVLYSWLFGWAGLKGIILLHAAIIGAAAMLSLRHMVSRGADALMAIVLMHVYIGASSVHYLARPHVFTLLFMAVGIWLLDQDRRQPSRAIWLLVPLTVLWVNLHAGFAGFLGSLWLFALGCAAEAIWDRGSGRTTAQAGRYGLLSLACSAASLLNPYGWREHLHLLQFVGQKWVIDMVEEHQPPKFQTTAGHYFEVLLIAGLFVATWLIWRRQWAWALVLLAWAHLGLTSVRHVPLFAIVLAPHLGPAVSTLWRNLTKNQNRRSLLGTLTELGRDHTPGFGQLSLWAPAVLALLWCANLGLSWPQTFPESRYPVSLVERHANLLATSRVLTTDGWGDYLTFRNYPRQRIYCDGRTDFLGRELEEEYLNLLNGRKGWDAVMRKWNFNVAMLPTDSALASLLRDRPDQWKLLEETGQAALFVRPLR